MAPQFNETVFANVPGGIALRGTGGTGVFAESTGTALHGISSAGTAVIGNGRNGIGVHGEGGGGDGVLGETRIPTAAGVHGRALGTPPFVGRAGFFEGTVRVNGQAEATKFVTTSDERLKTNVQQLGGTLNQLKHVRGVAFDWAETPQALGAVAGQSSIGVIAQEVEQVFPELVADGGDHDYKAIDYCGLTSVLVEAVKELKEENEALRSRIEALEQA